LLDKRVFAITQLSGAKLKLKLSLTNRLKPCYLVIYNKSRRMQSEMLLNLLMKI